MAWAVLRVERKTIEDAGYRTYRPLLKFHDAHA